MTRDFVAVRQAVEAVCPEGAHVVVSSLDHGARCGVAIQFAGGARRGFAFPWDAALLVDAPAAVTEWLDAQVTG